MTLDIFFKNLSASFFISEADVECGYEYLIAIYSSETGNKLANEFIDVWEPFENKTLLELIELIDHHAEFLKQKLSKVTESIDKVVEYLWHDEKKHYIESDFPEDHIFVHVNRLSKFVNNSED